MRITLLISIFILFNFFSRKSFCQEDACTLVGEKNEGTYLLSMDGEIISSTKYLEIGGLYEGRRSARKIIGKDTLAGYIDEEGMEYAFNFKNTFNFSEGFSVVQLNSNKYSLIDSNFHLVTKEQFDLILDLKQGFAPIRKDGKWSFINTKGELLFQPIYDDIYWFENGFSSVKKNNRYGYINQKGKLICEIKFAHWRNFDEDGYAFVFDDELGWTVIDTLGNYIYADQDYLIDNVHFNEFGQVRAYRKINENEIKYGYVDKKGKITIPIKFDKIESFYHFPVTGAAMKLKNGFYKYTLIDTAGNVVNEKEYDYIQYFYEGGVSMVTLNTINSKPIDQSITLDDVELEYSEITGKMGVIDPQGNIVIPVVYSRLSPEYSYHTDDYFSGQCLFSAKKEKDGLGGTLNDKGETLIPFEYQFSSTRYVGNGLFSLKNQDNEKVIFDTKMQNELQTKNSEYQSSLRRICQSGLMIFIDKSTSKVGVKNSNVSKWLIEPTYDKIAITNKSNNLWNLK